MKPIVVVLGAPRSGTSITSMVIHHCGIPMFPSQEKAVYGNLGDIWNQSGHYTDEDFHNIVMSRFFGVSVPDYEWFPDQEFLGMVQEASELRFSLSDRWGVKCLHSWTIIRALRQLGYTVDVIRTDRPVDQSQASYKERIGENLKEFSNEFIWRSKQESDKFYEQFDGTKMTVSFDDMYSNSSGVIHNISEFVGSSPTQNISNLINPSLRRFS